MKQKVERQETQLEIALAERIKRLETALDKIIGVACRCDNWESFPSDALDSAIDVLTEGR